MGVEGDRGTLVLARVPTRSARVTWDDKPIAPIGVGADRVLEALLLMGAPAERVVPVMRET